MTAEKLVRATEIANQLHQLRRHKKVIEKYQEDKISSGTLEFEFFSRDGKEKEVLHPSFFNIHEFIFDYDVKLTGRIKQLETEFNKL